MIYVKPISQIMGSIRKVVFIIIIEIIMRAISEDSLIK
jgi:hypothetical protein